MYDSEADTLKHIRRVHVLVDDFMLRLRKRALNHDRSKLHPPEKEIFDLYTPQLATLEYGSEEYRAALTNLGPALDHHYKHNRHHPEHHTNGVDDMTLIDLVEMLCDWKAASERHDTGYIMQSLMVNEGRFGLSPQLARILRNTAVEAGWIHQEDAGGEGNDNARNTQ